MSAHNDATFLRMFLLVLGSLLVFTFLIMFAASKVTGSLDEIKASDTMRLVAVEKRIAPVGQVKLAATAADAGASAAPAAARSGPDVYQAVCLACHDTGAAGAPKKGDKAAWEPRVAAGLDSLVNAAIAGKGAMPPRGGNPSTTDEEIRAAVEYLLSETGFDLSAAAAPAATPAAEPAAPAASAVEQVKEVAAEMVETAETTATDAVEQVATAAAGVVAAGQTAVAGAADQAKAAVAAVVPAGAMEVDLVQGEKIYKTACFACHDTGVANSPKLGDKAAWAPRIAQGSEMLLKNALNGKGAMPPKGGRVDLSDADITHAIAYIVSKSQ